MFFNSHGEKVLLNHWKLVSNVAFVLVGWFDENLVQPSIQVHGVVVASTGKFPYSRSCIQITKFLSSLVAY